MYRTAPTRLRHLIRCTAVLDRAAFTQLYEVLAPAVTARLTDLTADPARAGDLTAAAFVQVWHTANAHTADPDVAAWIIGIATDLAEETGPAAPEAQAGPESLAALLTGGRARRA